MIRNLRLILIFLLLSCLPIHASDCCAEESALFWPPPPAEMRIAFIKSIYSPRDIGIESGFFRKLKRIVIGDEEDVFNKPIAVAVDSQKRIYICDTGSPALHIFKQKEKKHKRIITINDEELISPVGVVAGDNGLVYLCDSKLKKVFCLDGEGKFKFYLGKVKKFLRPTGLAINRDRLYVVDTAAHRISIFDLNGNFISEFGNRGKGAEEFNYPTSLAIDKEGKIYVVDTLNFRIQVFDENNKFLYSIGQAGDSSGSFSRPKGIAIDSFGHIYTTDGMFDNFQIFNRNKDFLLSVGSCGQKDGEFWMPSGIAIDSDNYIYVADSYNQRIQVFRYVGKD